MWNFMNQFDILTRSKRRFEPTKLKTKPSLIRFIECRMEPGGTNISFALIVERLTLCCGDMKNFNLLRRLSYDFFRGSNRMKPGKSQNLLKTERGRAAYYLTILKGSADHST